jgi:alpha-galactosidase
MSADTVALLTAPEVLAVDQDPECVAGSLVRLQPGGGQLWMRPLSDGTFAAALFYPAPDGATQPLNMSVVLNRDMNYGDAYPALMKRASVRDLWKRQELGEFDTRFSALVPPNDAMIIKITPID